MTEPRHIDQRRLLRRLSFVAVMAMSGGLVYGYMSAEIEATFIEPGQDYFPVAMPDYPNAVQMPMGEGMRMNGEPMHMTWFSTPDDVERVMTYYRGVWESQGYRIFGDWTERSGHIHVVDDGGVRKGVTAQRQGQRTVVMPSVVHGNPLPMGAERDGRFPALEGSTPLTRLEAFDQGRRSITYMYENGDSLEANVEHVQQGMLLEGWVEDKRHEEPEGKPAFLAEFKRGGQRCHVNLIQRGSDEASRVFATFVLVGEDPAPTVAEGGQVP